MSKAIKLSAALSLLALALIVCLLAWRLWPDDGQARRQQRNRDLVRAVRLDDIAAATRLLDAGTDPTDFLAFYETPSPHLEQQP